MQTKNIFLGESGSLTEDNQDAEDDHDYDNGKSDIHPLFENSIENDVDELPLFESKELQRVFKEDNEEETRLMIEKNKDKTRLSMQLNMTPQGLKRLRQKHELQIKQGRRQ